MSVGNAKKKHDTPKFQFDKTKYLCYNRYITKGNQMTKEEITELVKAYQAGRLTLGEIYYAVQIWGGDLDEVLGQTRQ